MLCGCAKAWIFSTPIQFWVGWPLYVSAYKAGRFGHTANMDTLVMLSTTTAYVYSVIVTLVQVAGGTLTGTISHTLFACVLCFAELIRGVPSH